ncbi:MAG: SgcJ/EcaC family oxidoreductase [bacterium]
MTGLSLLIGGCDATTPSAPTAFAAGVTSASMSVGVAANVAPSDSAAVAAVSTAWDAAWNTANPAGIAALFLENSEIVNGRGQLVIGAAAIRANHAAAFASVFKGSRSRGIVRRIVFLSDAAAVLDVDNEVTGFTSLPGGAVPTQPGLNLQRHKRVLVKRNGQWRTALMQLTTVAPGAVPPPAP